MVDEVITTPVKLTLSEVEWRRLRVMAEREGVGMGVILARGFRGLSEFAACDTTEFCRLAGALSGRPGPEHSVDCANYRG